MGAIANLFGYVLNFFYGLVQNYGLAIIIFTVLLRLILLPLSMNQQKTMKKSAKLQEEMNKLQVKYKNNPEMLNKATMELYKTQKVSPFLGCLTSILQLVIFISVFYVISRPLTYMRKVDPALIDKYTTEISESGEQTSYPEIKIIESKANEDENVRLNMNFLGLDLSKVPMQNYKDVKVFIIPALYVLVTFITIKVTNNMTSKKKAKDSSKDTKLISAKSVEKSVEKDKENTDKKEKNKKSKNEKAKIKEDKLTEKVEEPKKKVKVEEEEKAEEQIESMQQMSNSMNYMVPIMSVAIALIAPLGLSLYWLVSNVLQLLERIVINRIVDKNEE